MVGFQGGEALRRGMALQGRRGMGEGDL